MKKMLIPIAILCVVIGLIVLPNGETGIKLAPVPALAVTHTAVKDVPEPVPEVPATPLPEIKSASAETEKPVAKVAKLTSTPETTTMPEPTATPTQTPVPTPTPASAPVPAPAVPQPVQAGDMVYVEGFGWLESQGEGTVIHDDMMYENGNKAGIMD